MKVTASIVQAATIGIVIGSLLTAFMFLYVAPSSSMNPVGAYRDTPLRNDAIDSLIIAWCDVRPMDLYTAAGFQRVGSTTIGIRAGVIPDSARHLARIVDSLFGIPAAVTLSQFILESKFGLNDLGASNYFGHGVGVAERYGPKPSKRVMALTKEYLDGRWVTLKKPFSAYASAEQCFMTHGKFLSTSSLYRSALKYKSNAALYARELSRFYATDPSYQSKLLFLISYYKLAG